jgi:hypothetical protein
MVARPFRLLPLRRMPELEKTCLVGMQGQSEVPRPLAESVLRALRILLLFESGDEVIGVPNQGRLAV